MQQQQQQSLEESCSDHNILHHMHSQDPLFNIPNNMYNNHGMHIPSDYSPDLEAQQQQHNSKINGFGPTFRSSTAFSSFPNSNRTRHAASSSVLTTSNPYRDTSSAFYPNSADVFSSHLTSPTQSHIQPYDSRASFDFGTSTSQSSTVGAHKQSYGMVDPFGNTGPSSALLQSHQVGGKSGTSSHTQQQHNGYPQQSAQYVNGIHLSSQTPYGPHIPSNVPPTSVGGNSTSAGAGVGASSGIQTSAGMNGSAQPNPSQEEISTIFVVGFPEDMQEREFQNMFTFSAGFEAATLKIPNKEYTAYGGVVGAGAPSAGLRSAGSGYAQGYGGSNDPYNLVTVNQGGVVVDGGRDGTMASWPASVPGGDDGGGGGHFIGAGGNSGGGGGGGGLSMPPRKQIIGFAKFRTRDEALAARDVLQGRRVDIEKGAVLKAEMAKKNLHTKRGVGPVPGMSGVVGPGGSSNGGIGVSGGGGGAGSGGMSGMGGMGSQQAAMNGVGLTGVAEGSYGMGVGLGGSGGGSETMSVRERELGTLGAMGLGMGGVGRMNQWREQMQDSFVRSSSLNNGNSGNSSSNVIGRDREEEEQRRREREVGVINAMGLGVGAGTRGPRERVEEDERERRRKEKEMRLRAGNSPAFDAFHSLPLQPISRQTSNATGSASSSGGSGAGLVVSPTGSNNSLLTPLESGSGTAGSNSPMLGNGFGQQTMGQSSPSVVSVQPQPQDDIAAVGPWDNVRKGSVVLMSSSSSNVPLTSPSQRSNSPTNTNSASASSPPFSAPRACSPSLDGFTPNQRFSYRDAAENGINSSNGRSLPHHHQQQNNNHRHEQSESSSSSVAGESQSGGSTSEDVSRVMDGLAVTTHHGNTSPQLPSPASGTSSGSARNVVDQNPPINTLYVGNLPTSSPPPGYPHDHLEDSLRELFKSRPGYRRLCFRQKNNGPMCFVEFEDVNHATKTLNDLYGNTLNGLVKGGGIRLSYSKNPLGVRTPPSAGGNGPSLQQQQQMQNNSHQASGSSPFLSEAFQQQQTDEPRPTVLRRDMAIVSPPAAALPLPSSYSSFLASPPPRFYSSSPSSAFGASSVPLTASSSAFLPRGGNVNLQGYNLAASGSSSSLTGSLSTFSPFGISTPPHSTIPDQMNADQPHNEQPHHFMHRTLSPPANNIEAARAG